MNTLFCGFSSFWRVFSLVVVQSALISLGAMLMVVPGIILACGYSQSYYLLLDHPDWGPMDAMRISRFIMRGRKWAWFKLQLSFLGWLVLSVLTFGLLNIWLDPYMEITNAHFYGTLISRIGEIPGAQTMDGFGREDGVPPDAEDTAPGSDAPGAADAGQKEPKDDRPAPEDFWKP